MLFLPAQDVWQAPAILALVALAAAGLARGWPAYRAELAVEARTRLLSLDGLRGVLCFGVMIHHAACTLQYFGNGELWVSPASHVYTMLGGTSVCLFFCITGFLFWGRVLRLDGRMDWFDFARGRVLRVVPMYAAAAVPVLAIATWQFVQIHASRGQIARDWFEVATVGLLEWHPVTTADGYAIPSRINAGVHWSLRYEWMFYAALPLLAPLARGRRPLLIWACWIVALVASACVGKATFATMFPIGMLAAHAARREPLAAGLRRAGVSVAVLAAVALIAALGCRASGPLALTADTRSPVAHLLLLVAFVPIACGNDLFGVLRWRSLRLMGAISYGVYLTHGIVLFCSRGLLARLVRGPDDPNVLYWLAIAGLAVVTLLLASVTYLAIERPFVDLEHRMRRRRRPAADQPPAGPEIVSRSFG